MTNDRRDDYGEATDVGVVRFQRLLPGPIERVWAYLTESEKRAKWFAGGEMDLRAGGQAELKFRHANLNHHREPVPEKYRQAEEGVAFMCEITRCEPPRLLSFTWPEESAPASEVTFELAPQGDRVLLVLTHRRLRDRAAMTNVSSGWHLHLDFLADQLEGQPPRPFWSTQARLEAEYARRLLGGAQ